MAPTRKTPPKKKAESRKPGLRNAKAKSTPEPVIPQTNPDASRVTKPAPAAKATKATTAAKGGKGKGKGKAKAKGKAKGKAMSESPELPDMLDMPAAFASAAPPQPLEDLPPASQAFAMLTIREKLPQPQQPPPPEAFAEPLRRAPVRAARARTAAIQRLQLEETGTTTTSATESAAGGSSFVASFSGFGASVDSVLDPLAVAVAAADIASDPSSAMTARPIPVITCEYCAAEKPKRKCDWVDQGRLVIECTTCADLRLQDPSHPSCTIVGRRTKTHKRYAYLDPIGYSPTACKRCIANKIQNLCDADVILGVACSACGDRGRCTLPDNQRMKAPTKRVKGFRKWYRHACDTCVNEDDPPNAGPRCSWLDNRKSWNEACFRCRQHGMSCIDEGIVIAHPQSLRAPETWEPLSVTHGGRAVLALDTPWRLPCVSCLRDKFTCRVGAKTPFSACSRCAAVGLDCVDKRGNQYPIFSLASVGFGPYMPHHCCPRCMVMGRPCDRQRPCDSCVQNGEQQLCRLQDARSVNCIRGRLNPPPGPLYYLALGYGASGVDEVKDGKRIEHWIGPPTAAYAIYDNKFYQATIARDMDQCRREFIPAGPPIHAGPGGWLQPLLPSEITLQHLFQYFRQVKPSMHRPGGDFKYQLAVGAIRRHQREWRERQPSAPEPQPQQVPSSSSSSSSSSGSGFEPEFHQQLLLPPPPIGFADSAANRETPPPPPPISLLPLPPPIPLLPAAAALGVPMIAGFSPSQPPYFQFPPAIAADEGSLSPLNPNNPLSPLDPNNPLGIYNLDTLDEMDFDMDFDMDFSQQDLVFPSEPDTYFINNPIIPIDPNLQVQLSPTMRWRAFDPNFNFDQLAAKRPSEEIFSWARTIGAVPWQPFRFAQGLEVANCPAVDVLDHIPLRVVEVESEAVPDPMSSGTVPCGEKHCGNLTSPSHVCCSDRHGERVCTACAKAGSELLASPQYMPITRLEFMRMRVYLCRVCTQECGNTPARIVNKRVAGVRIVFGDFLSQGPNLPGTIRAGEDGAIYLHRDLLPLTGCACATKLLRHRQCRSHRIYNAEIALRQTNTMRIWLRDQFSGPVCPCCMVTNLPVPTSVQDANDGLRSWVCLVCNGWVINAPVYPKMAPGWEHWYDTPPQDWVESLTILTPK